MYMGPEGFRGVDGGGDALAINGAAREATATSESLARRWVDGGVTSDRRDGRGYRRDGSRRDNNGGFTSNTRVSSIAEQV